MVRFASWSIPALRSCCLFWPPVPGEKASPSLTETNSQIMTSSPGCLPWFHGSFPLGFFPGETIHHPVVSSRLEKALNLYAATVHYRTVRPVPRHVSLCFPCSYPRSEERRVG